MAAVASSARGSNFGLNPRVEARRIGSTPATMTPAPEGGPPGAPTPPGGAPHPRLMRLPFRAVKLRELPPISRPGEGPPRALRVVGFAALAVIFVSIPTVDPNPGLHGDGPLVALGFVLLAVGIAGSLGRRPMAAGRR